MTDGEPDVKPVHVVSPAPRDVWRKVADADPHALATQSPEWTDVLVGSGRWLDASRAYTFASGRQVILPLVRRRGLGVRGPHWSFGEGWGMGGVLAPDGAVASDVAAATADVAALPAVRVSVRPNPVLAEQWRDGTAVPGWAASPRRAHVLDLSGGAAAVWDGRFHKDTRRYVRRAERDGITVVRDVDGTLVPVFYEMLLASFERWADRSREPKWMAVARGKQRDPLRKFVAWREGLGDAFRLYVAFRDGIPAAGIVVLFGANAHYTRGAMDAEVAGKSHANDLLHWTAISEACADGCGAYHMGETGTSSSLARFKEKFGARPIPYAEYRIERVPITAVDGAVRSTVKRVIGFQDA